MRRCSPSEDLGLGLQCLDQVRHSAGAFADDSSRGSLWWQLELLYGDFRVSERRRLDLEGLLLGGHYSLEGRIARDVESLVHGKHGRQRKFDNLLRALD